MSYEPNYCSECLKENRIATTTGPTCTHKPDHDAKWFPILWERMTESERVEWIWAKRTKGEIQ